MIRWLYLTVIVIGLGFWHFPANDPDLGWHLFGGAWISANGSVPSEDVVNSFNTFWHDYHWLGQVAMYKIFVLGGYDGLRIALALVIASLSKVMLDIIVLAMGRRKSPLLALLFYLASITLINTVTSVRIQLLAVLLVALSIRRLMQPAARWELAYLFGLAVLLVNIHVYWVLIPMLWGLYRCMPRILGRRELSARYVWGGAFLLGLAGLVSPYGIIHYGYTPPFVFMNYAVLWDYLVMPGELRRTIGEFKQSLLATGFTPWIWVVYVICLARLFRWKRFVSDIGNGLSAIVFAIPALRAIKFVSLFGVACLPYLVKHATPVLRRSAPKLFDADSFLAKAFIYAILAIAVVQTTRSSPWLNNNEDFIHKYNPLKACKAIAQAGLTARESRGHVRVLTHFNNGGWCRWVLYQHDPGTDYRVTTDGRTQGVPVQHFYDSFDLYRARKNWVAILKERDPDVALVPKDSSLVQFMIRAPQDWELLYHDEEFAVFLPKPEPRI